MVGNYLRDQSSPSFDGIRVIELEVNVGSENSWSKISLTRKTKPTAKFIRKATLSQIMFLSKGSVEVSSSTTSSPHRKLTMVSFII